MKKSLSIMLIMTLLLIIIVGCTIRKIKDMGNDSSTLLSKAETSQQEEQADDSEAYQQQDQSSDTEDVTFAELYLNTDKFAGIEESIDVKKALIKIDGNGDDWEDINSYDVVKGTNGKDLKFKCKVSIAWDGNKTMFVKGVLTGPGEMLAVQAQDSSDWWSDDVLEVFMVTELPNDEEDNRLGAGHYAANAKHVFEAEDLLKGAMAANISLKDGEWVVELGIPLESEYLDKIKQSGYLYVKVGIEINSGGEYSLLGRIGGFWDVDNYIKFKF